MVLSFPPVPVDTPFAFVEVHIASLPANEGFIHLNVTAEFASRDFVLHGETNAVEHEPCGLLSNLNVFGDFVATDSVFAVGDHPHCHEPFVERDGGIFHDGSDLDGELALGVMAGALPDAAISVELHLVRSASRTDHAAIGPAADC
jgi:hypothetical protein